MNKVSGVGRDEPTVVNDKGAKQSRTLYAFDLLDPHAMFEMTKSLKEGAEKYGVDNWRGISVRDHLNHMLIHAYAYLAGDKSDDHLSHIMCRAMFAQAVDIEDNMVVRFEEVKECDHMEATPGADLDGDICKGCGRHFRQVEIGNMYDPKYGPINMIDAIEKAYGQIPAKDLIGKIDWLKDNLLKAKLPRGFKEVRHDYKNVELKELPDLRFITDPFQEISESFSKHVANACEKIRSSFDSNKSGGFKGGD